MNLKTISWKNNSIRIIDQTKLPGKLVFLKIRSLSLLWRAIKELKVRGAPALGGVAGLGVYLGIKDFKGDDKKAFLRKLKEVSDYLGSSRPTARNLFWGIERMQSAAVNNRHSPVPEIKKLLFAQAQKIIEEDRQACRRIGFYAARFFHDGDAVLTICNAGILATIDYGTALGAIYRAKEDGKRLKVYACETRPLLQGARLTTWELRHQGVDVTLICDNMAASLMREGKVKKVITGADRIAANGDTANKIGTLGLAVLANYHKIPFYVAAPASTFDLKIKNGRQIPIEQRDAKEVTSLFFKQPITAKGVKVYNPAFDVTPHELITAIITDQGVVEPPYSKNIRKIICK
ncbi:MAG: S-methyl-5-thioribose-1-phosphate isomerase [Candidatus Omnitrophica bacterium]|nr:S-methyl-5-thioribose-1-phosphate isomerase [Candidatus Omnitrophota bacterium]